MPEPIVIAQSDLSGDLQWLAEQPVPVIAYGNQPHCTAADVVVDSAEQANALVERIRRFPQASMTLVQVLRATENLPCALALDVESLAYSTLQAGPEFARWRATYQAEPLADSDRGDAILLERENDVVAAILNRPASRNSISVEMRDALVELLEWVKLDEEVKTLRISGKGACFSAGGELREFGSAPDPATAHWVRSVHSPARLLAQLSDRIECVVHGACIGSGIELPAFARRLVAHRKTFFHLPELELGLIPGAGGTFSISRRIGRQRTAWMVLSGKRINASTALQWGLVDEVIEPG